MTEKIRTCSRKRANNDTSSDWSGPDGDRNVVVDDIKRRNRCGLFYNESVIIGNGKSSSGGVGSKSNNSVVTNDTGKKNEWVPK